ncbi:SWIM zinc finger domain-containing protein [Streptomyces sp. NPDC059874]|uniref:SWIM zinc finger family protein n=1 Tax=Streptomyces sp. NPDC059874 TaxID=3346983 RepID=UPI00364A788A
MNDVAQAPGFTEKDLRRLAGPRSFERGLGYLSAVSRLEIGYEAITATVDGTDAYEVELTEDEDSGLSGWCDCPYGQEGNFCKHCVAVGLAVLRQAESVPRQRSAAASRTRLLDTWLESRTREELLALVREQLADDRALRRRLELRAATAGEDTGIVRERILSLLDTRPFARYGYVEYADARAYGRQAAEAVTALRALTASGRASDAVEVAREALRALGRTYGEIDDSDGLIGAVAAGLAEAHLEACRAARPDQVETAEWLVPYLLDEVNGAADIDLFDYREVLGSPGLARARALVVAAWRANPKGWAEKYLMERLLKVDGDSVDTLVAVHSADLVPNGHTHLVIARELERAGRADEALEWAERGLRESVSEWGPDDDLVAFVCARYERADRLADAVEVRRELLRARPSPAAYRHLRTTARAAGIWEVAERAGALEVLKAARPREVCRRDGSLLIDALIDDNDFQPAWQAATDGYANERQWLALAGRIREQQPADALGVYLRCIEPLLEQTGDSTYERLAQLLLGARACHRTLGTEAEFVTFLAALRGDQKRKRKLMAVLDRHGLRVTVRGG